MNPARPGKYLLLIASFSDYANLAFTVAIMVYGKMMRAIRLAHSALALGASLERKHSHSHNDPKLVQIRTSKRHRAP